MGTITDFMETDHRRCDDIFVIAERAASEGDWATAEREFEHFYKATEHHFGMEEGVLFPAFEEASGSTMGPTQVMRHEHEQMRALFSEMAEAVKARNADEFLGAAETLLILMQQHNRKEEQILYPMTDQVLGAQSAALLERMQAAGDA